MTRTLSEVVAEGKRLHAEHDAATMVRSLKTAKRLTMFYAQHGPRLLAVAEKAMEAEIVVRNILTAHEASLTERGTLSYSSPSGSTGFIAAIHWLEAFDALAATAPGGEGSNG